MTGWAATNTLRKCEVQHWGDGLTTPDRRVISKEFDAALALVETALDAAERVADGFSVVQSTDEAKALDALAAALRAVREGA